MRAAVRNGRRRPGRCARAALRVAHARHVRAVARSTILDPRCTIHECVTRVRSTASPCAVQGAHTPRSPFPFPSHLSPISFLLYPFPPMSRDPGAHRKNGLASIDIAEHSRSRATQPILADLRTNPADSAKIGPPIFGHLRRSSRIPGKNPLSEPRRPGGRPSASHLPPELLPAATRPLKRHSLASISVDQCSVFRNNKEH